MKTLVTGGTGFIGNHLVRRLLADGHSVRSVARCVDKARWLADAGVEVIPGDLNSEAFDWTSALNDVDVVFHLAGVTRARVAREYYEGNYCVTQRLARACCSDHQHLSRLVYVSSLSAVGPSQPRRPIDERSPYNPVSDYGKSKMLGEIEILRISQRVPVTIVRPTAVYGPYERDMMSYIVATKRGFQPLIGLRSQWLNLIYCDDLVEGILGSTRSAKAIGQTYLLGGDNYDTVEIADTIARVVHGQPLRVHIPFWLVYCLGATSEAIGRMANIPVYINLEKAKEIVQRAWICSSDKAESDFGFRPRVSLLEGMTKTYRWYSETTLANIQRRVW